MYHDSPPVRQVETAAFEGKDHRFTAVEPMHHGVPMCGICYVTNGLTRYEFREMMFGFQDRFTYHQCAGCGCMQISEVPNHLDRYYPPSYYSFANDENGGGVRTGGTLRRLRSQYAYTGRGFSGRALSLLFPHPFSRMRERLSATGLTTRSRILDVGCGSGRLLRELAAAGYTSLLGIDPFVERDSEQGGVTVLKAKIQQLEGSFDLIMFHHSLEHVADQHETMRAVVKLLSPAGCCLIRIPLVSSYAWEYYRENWVQLDAPRHLFIHSARSIQMLAEQSGLILTGVEYDSTELQFTGSELYRRDIPLVEGRDRFSSEEIRRYRRWAEALNQKHRGDQAAFYFRKA